MTEKKKLNPRTAMLNIEVLDCQKTDLTLPIRVLSPLKRYTEINYMKPSLLTS